MRLFSSLISTCSLPNSSQSRLSTAPTSQSVRAGGGAATPPSAGCAARDAAISIKLRAGIGSSKAEQGPLIVPSQRQARLYQQLVCGQPARQAPLENGSRDVWGEIAEADKPRENQLQKSGERIIVFRQWVGWRRSAARGTIKAPKLSVRLEGLRPSEPGARNKQTFFPIVNSVTHLHRLIVSPWQAEPID